MIEADGAGEIAQTQETEKDARARNREREKAEDRDQKIAEKIAIGQDRENAHHDMALVKSFTAVREIFENHAITSEAQNLTCENVVQAHEMISHLAAPKCENQGRGCRLMIDSRLLTSGCRVRLKRNTRLEKPARAKAFLARIKMMILRTSTTISSSLLVSSENQGQK